MSSDIFESAAALYDTGRQICMGHSPSLAGLVDLTSSFGAQWKSACVQAAPEGLA